MSRKCPYCFMPNNTNAQSCSHCGKEFERKGNDNESLPIGAVVGQNLIHSGHQGFVVEKVIGRGGFGITYLARNLGGSASDFGNYYALKELMPRQAVFRDQQNKTAVCRHSNIPERNYQNYLKGFLKEVGALAKVSESSGITNTAKVQLAFEENNTAYYIMDYIEGKNLKEILDKTQQPLDIALAWRCLRPIANTLRQLHAHNIVHRDVKPENIILREKDRQAFLIDFGAAREFLSDSSMVPMLTHGFAPPEQYFGLKADQRAFTDVYALAATIYYAITRKNPQKSIERQGNDRLQASIQLQEKLTQNQKSVLIKALELDSGQRYQNMEEFMIAMDACVKTDNEPSSKPIYINPKLFKDAQIHPENQCVQEYERDFQIRSATENRPPEKHRKRRKGLIVLIVAVVLALGVMAAFSTGLWTQIYHSIINDEADYVLPQSDSKVYTEAEIIALTPYERCVARNEIYAKHGLMFKTEELQEYFNSKKWYMGLVYKENFDESVLNEYEQKNVALILKVEEQYGEYSFSD